MPGLFALSAYTFQNGGERACKKERAGKRIDRRRWGGCGRGPSGRRVSCGTNPAGARRRQPGSLCFPLDTAVWRVSDAMAGGRTPLPGKSVPPGAGPCLCGGHGGAGGRDGGGDCCRVRVDTLRQLSALLHPDGSETALRPPAIPLCPPGRRYSRADAGHSRADRACHRGTPAL